jgi:hypothetical protein
MDHEANSDPDGLFAPKLGKTLPTPFPHMRCRVNRNNADHTQDKRRAEKKPIKALQFAEKRHASEM